MTNSRIESVIIRNMKPNEEIKLVLRRHWIMYVYLALWTSIPVLTTILLLAVWKPIALLTGANILGLLLVIFWQFSLLFLYVKWVNYELDLFIITTNRVIGIDQISFLNRTVSECSLAEVQEVNAQTSGILANIFGFGAVYISTASKQSHFIVTITPDALVNARTILNVIDEFKTKLRPAEPQKTIG